MQYLSFLFAFYNSLYLRTRSIKRLKVFCLYRMAEDGDGNSGGEKLQMSQLQGLLELLKLSRYAYFTWYGRISRER